MEQYKIEYILLADAANIDSFGKLNVLGIFQNIYLNKIPGSILKFSIISSISVLDPSKPFTIDIKIIDSKGDPVKIEKPLSFPFKPQEGNKDNKINLLIDMVNLQFNFFGKYEIEISVDNKKIGSSFLLVTEKKSQ